MSAPIWKGSRLLTEAPDSPVIEETGTEISITQTYSGPFDVCRSSKPGYGAICGVDARARVRKTTVSKSRGGVGKLVVTSSVQVIPEGDNSPMAAPVPEIDWVRIEKPLAQHPLFKDDLDPQMISNAKKWAEDPTSYTGPAFPTGSKQALYATKLARGQDTYVVYAPVVKLTTEHNGQPNTGSCGTIDTPPVVVPGAWHYLKTADSARGEKGRWSRSQEWTGADSIDTDIYGPGSGLP